MNIGCNPVELPMVHKIVPLFVENKILVRPEHLTSNCDVPKVFHLSHPTGPLHTPCIRSFFWCQPEVLVECVFQLHKPEHGKSTQRLPGEKNDRSVIPDALKANLQVCPSIASNCIKALHLSSRSNRTTNTSIDIVNIQIFTQDQVQDTNKKTCSRHFSWHNCVYFQEQSNFTNRE